MENLFLPGSIILGLISFTLLAKWYAMPKLSLLRLEDALVPLLMLHTFRYVGWAFLIPGVTRVPLDPAFAEPAAYGDLIAAVLALLAAYALRSGWPFAVRLVWIFSVVGFLDLLNALYKGFRLTPDGDLGAAFFIPAVIVPALLVTHVMIVRLLLRSRPARAVPA